MKTKRESEGEELKVPCPSRMMVYDGVLSNAGGKA